MKRSLPQPPTSVPGGKRLRISEAAPYTKETLEHTQLPSDDVSLLQSRDPEQWAAACHRSADTFENEDIQQPTFPEHFEPFRYQPLDCSQPSIRLIYILPDLSREGLLQCKVIHAATSDLYVCLSYVWNYSTSPDSTPATHLKERVILLNEALYAVRENLFDFLCMARYNSSRKPGDPRKFDLSVPIWIDALCINQSDPKERNHQVAHMGKIYSNASTVHSWLGKAGPNLVNPGFVKDIVGCRLGAVSERLATSLQDLAACPVWTASATAEQDADVHPACRLIVAICSNSYWKRAWVIQEILLAGFNTFWIHTEAVDLRSISAIMTFLRGLRLEETSKMREESSHYLDLQSSIFEKAPKANLIELLHRYANKGCADPRDRVYSVLSLCTAQSRVEVDYSIDAVTLAYRVLKQHPGRTCICSAIIVCRTLEISMEDERALNILDGPWIEFKVNCYIDKDNHLRLNSFYYICGSTRLMVQSLLDSEYCAKTRHPDMCALEHKDFDPLQTVRISLAFLTTWAKERVRCCANIFHADETSSAKSRVVLGWGITRLRPTNPSRRCSL